MSTECLFSEEDLTHSLEVAMDKYPETYAVLVRRHGVYDGLTSVPRRC